MGNTVTKVSSLEDSIQLDVVGLLAVIGESAMSTHAQIATATKWSLLPRLIPAPQALLRHTRPHRLPPVLSVKVIGIHSGNQATELNYFPNLLHGIENNADYSFEEVKITHCDTEGQPSGIRIPVKRMGPLVILSIFGMLCSAGLLALAIHQEDWVAVLAVGLLSLTSTLVGLGSRWVPVIPQRKEKRIVPPADIMIKGRQGAFIHVKCTENIARELYFGQETCKYDIDDRWFYVISGTGTFLMMAAVIAMANCTFILQAGLGLAYIVLNGLYWIAALVPGEWHWELGVYEVTKTEKGTKRNYTEVLIEAIGATRSTKWVTEGDVAPKTEAWREWLLEVEKLFKDNEGLNEEEMLVKWNEWNPSDQLTSAINRHGTLPTAVPASDNTKGILMIQTTETSPPIQELK